jgi:hypothetical protein
VKWRLGGWCEKAATWELVNWSNSAVVGYLLDSNDVSTETEESLLLRSVTGKRLVKADWEGLACAVVICNVWRLVIALQLLVVTIGKWSINPVIHTRDSIILQHPVAVRILTLWWPVRPKHVVFYNKRQRCRSVNINILIILHKDGKKLNTKWE